MKEFNKLGSIPKGIFLFLIFQGKPILIEKRLIRDFYNGYYERKLKEESTMAIWELALLLLAITYMMVNTVYMIVSVKTLAKYDGILTKSIKFLEKMLDKAEKDLDE